MAAVFIFLLATYGIYLISIQDENPENRAIVLIAFGLIAPVLLIYLLWDKPIAGFEKAKIEFDKGTYPFFFPGIFISAVLLLTVFEWPQGYYLFLRWSVALTSILVAINFFKLDRKQLAWIFGFIALLFNPLQEFHLERRYWLFIDFIVASIFFWLGTTEVEFVLMNEEE